MLTIKDVFYIHMYLVGICEYSRLETRTSLCIYIYLSIYMLLLIYHVKGKWNCLIWVALSTTK